MPQLEDRNARRMQRKLDAWRDPPPTLRELLEGIPRRNDGPDNAGQLWPVARAFASRRQRYKRRLWGELWGPGA
eukprot:4410849-Pyramimonas_sp.AAC.1